MENRAHALIAGIFVLVLSASAAFGIWWFGEGDEPLSDYLVVTQGNVTGLNPQASVRYRGILVGKVVAIRLDEANSRDILIQIRVRRSVRITAGTRAKLAYQGVTGIAHILLEDRTQGGEVISATAAGLPRIKMEASFFDNLGDSGGRLIQETGELLARANTLLNEENQLHARQLLANLDKATAQLILVAEKLQPAIVSGEQFLKQGAALLSEDNVARVASGLDSFDRAANSADRVFERWQSLSDDWTKLAKRIDELSTNAAGNEGLAGLTKRLNRLSRDVERSNAQLSRVLQSIEENPNSLFVGAPTVAPGPGEPGFSAPPQRGSKVQ